MAMPMTPQMPAAMMMANNGSANNGNIVPGSAIAPAMSATDRKNPALGPAASQECNKIPTKTNRNSSNHSSKEIDPEEVIKVEQI